jgi:hypothetical protein
MTGRSRNVADSLLVAAMLCGSRDAVAERRDLSPAEVLFQEGRTLMSEGRYTEACAKLAESERLEPAGGTLLNLAFCHEKEGKVATAWREFADVAEVSRASRPDRVKIAEQHRRALEPKLARLTLRVPVDARVDGLAIAIDGVARVQETWATAEPIDPGEHRVRASAGGHRSWETSIAIAEAEQRTVDVPALDVDAPIAAPAAPIVIAPPTPSRAPSVLAPVAPVVRRSPPPVAAYVVTGAGVVALGVGAYFGIRAMQQSSDANRDCGTTDCRTSTGVTLNDDAQRSARWADIAIGAGLVGVGVGVVWLLSAPSTEAMPTHATLRLTPTIAPDRAGLGLVGTF